MQKYFKRIAEYVKAFQYNGETREELPQWVLELEKDCHYLNSFTINKYTSYMMFDGNEIKNTDWIVVTQEEQFLMSDAAFRELYEVDDMEDLA